jgi:hypothetical protein
VILAVGQLACSIADVIVDEQFPLPTSPSATLSAVPPAAGFVPSVDPKADLLLAYDKLQSAYPYKITETSTNSSSPDTHVRVKEAAGPGEQYVTWTSPSSSGEMIETGGFFYLFYNGAWSKSDVAPLAMPTEIDLVQYFIKELADVYALDPDSSIGIETFTYYFSTNLPGNPGTGVVWLGTSSGLPYKASYASTSEDNTFTVELVYEYDLEVTITAPIP